MLKTITLCFAFAACALCTSITQSVTCIEQNGPVQVTAVNSCALSDGTGDANVMADSSLTTPGIAGNSFMATSSAYVLTESGFYPSPTNYEWYGSDATASASLTMTVDTPGPVRQGYIEIDLTGDAFSWDGEGEFFGQVGSYEGSGLGDGGPEGGSCGGTCGYKVLPFTLGTLFTISFGTSAQDGADAQSDYGGSATANVSLSFSLFEADGVTPVDMTQAGSGPISEGLVQVVSPEPSSFWIFLLIGATSFWIFFLTGCRAR